MKTADTQFFLPTTDDPAAPAPRPGDQIVFDAEESHHAARVLRLRAGDRMQATDGRGLRCQLHVLEPDARALTAEVLRVEALPEPSARVVVALGMLKKRDRMEFAVEKLVELGALGIVPMATDHSEKGGGRPDRIEAVVRRALKQSMRPHLPTFRVAGSLREAVIGGPDGTGAPTSHWDRIVLADELAHPSTGNSPAPSPDQAPSEHSDHPPHATLVTQSVPHFSPLPMPGHTLLLIGPEGGFSRRERDWLRQQRPTPEILGLGAYRLRAETAAIAGLLRLIDPE